MPFCGGVDCQPVTRGVAFIERIGHIRLIRPILMTAESIPLVG